MPPSPWASPSLAGTTAVDSDWWHAFQDPILDRMMTQGLQHNASLASAVASVDEATANARIASASLSPSLSIAGAAGRGHGRSGGASNSQSLYGEASYEFDFWGRNAANARAAARLADASMFDRDTVAMTLTANIANTYFAVQGLRRRLQLAQTIAGDANRILMLVQAQQAAGVATELQVQQQRNALATFNAAIPTLQQQLDIDVHALATLTGSAPEQFAVQDRWLSTIAIPEPRAGVPSSLLELRPDIRSKEAQLQAANQDVGAARAAFFPNIALTGDFGFSSGGLAGFLANPFASAAASLTAPLFDGGALRGQLQLNRAAAAKAVADYRQTVLSALQDVEDALTAEAQERRIEQSDTEADDAAQKAADLANAQYRSGTVDFLTVLDSERTRYQAQDTLIQARVQRLQAAVGVFRAFGGNAIALSSRTGSPVL